MKHISRLLILCMLLMGCAKSEAVSPVPSPLTEAVEVKGLYDPGSSLEISSLGAIRVYPLGTRTGKAILPFGDGLLLFSQGEKTTLTLLAGDTLVPQAVKSLRFSLEPEDCVVSGERLSFFDPKSQQTLLLDGNLDSIAQIDIPKGLIGKPMLSIEENKLYYRTASAIRVWDLDTNIQRVLRETTLSDGSVSGLYCSGTVLRCIEDTGASRFYDAQTGALLYEDSARMKLAAEGGSYTAAVWESNLWNLVFQLEGGEKQALTPRELSADFFLLETQPTVVTAALSGKVVTLDSYDLATGNRTATLMLRGQMPNSIVEKDGFLWGLGYLEDYAGAAIFRWDPARTPVSDATVYTGPHYTAAQPDIAGLTRCKETAKAIGSSFGLDILVWEDTVKAAPQLQPEHRVNVLNRELELLDTRLSRFPAEVLKTTAVNFPALTICLVAQSNGSPCVSSRQATIVLCAGSTSENELYHGLFHGMETHILSHSSAFDQWNTLNPQGFQYDYNYASNKIRDSGIYLTQENRSFVDTFSMSYPKEDRARVFEYAMLPDQQALFETKAMQKKLAAICRGIREAYGLDSEEVYPWEQYLK